MSVTRTEITLTNTGDVESAARGFIKESEVRQMTVEAMADTGAWTLVVNKEISDKLGLRVKGYEDGTMADGRDGTYEMVGPLEVRWKNRRYECDALLLPDAKEPLLGALPLEAMDLIVDCKNELVGAHGDTPMHRV